MKVKNNPKIEYKQWSDLKDDKEQQAIYRENVEFVSNLYNSSYSKKQ